MTKIDPHGAALNLLHEERDALEYSLKTLKPQIRKLNQLRQANNVEAREVAEFLFGGTMGELTKDSNELRRRLNGIEATRKLLKYDRALQQESAWEDEQHELEMAKAKAVPYVPVLECGCW
jgi:DNA repair exonuclease SbcCD ATPase subunit